MLFCFHQQVEQPKNRRKSDDAGKFQQNFHFLPLFLDALEPCVTGIALHASSFWIININLFAPADA